MRWIAALTMLPLLGACFVNPYYDPAKPHHTPDGFRNTYPHAERQSWLKWRWQRLWSDIPPPPENDYRFEIVETDVDFLRRNRSEVTLTWIGHASLLLQVGGVNILTDPQFSERASPVSWTGPARKVAPALRSDQLPHIDVVLISHNHYDHLDLDSVQALAAQPGGPPHFFVPLGLQAWFVDAGIATVVEQDWWDFTDTLGLRIHEVPSQHFSARTPFDRDETLWGGFVVEHPQLRFYFAGDAGYSRDFADIGARLGPIDLAALPIGSYEPRWFMRTMHVNPAEAVQAYEDLGARYAVAMHWGTFEMTDEAIDEPPKALARALTEKRIAPERFFVMKHGETRHLAPLLRGTFAREPAPREAARERAPPEVRQTAR